MTGVVELLAEAGDTAPVQRVRNYHLAGREAVPRPRDFLTAMRRTDGAVVVRWAGPPGECFVRYADPGWERAEHDRFRGRTSVETVEADRVRTWLRGSRPELVAHEDVRASFEVESDDAPAESVPSGESIPRATDAAGTETGSPGPAATDGGAAAGTTVRVQRRDDLRADSALDAADAEAVAAALPAGPDRLVFRLPLVLAEETVLAPTAESDRVFVGEAVPERETDRAYYVRQGRRGGWVPKREARVYELAGSALGGETGTRRESV